MKKPIEPNRPPEPLPTKEVLRDWAPENVSLAEINEHFSDIDSSKVFFEVEFDYESTDYRFVAYTDVLSPRYLKQKAQFDIKMESYEKRLAKYHSDLKLYEETKEERDLEKRRAEFERLKKEFEPELSMEDLLTL